MTQASTMGNGMGGAVAGGMTAGMAGGVTHEVCQVRYRSVQSLAWRLFGGFAMIIVTLSLAGAAHMTLKADAGEVVRLESRTQELERCLTTIREDLSALRAEHRHVAEDVRVIRETLERRKEER